MLTKHGRTFELSVTRVPKNTYEELCSSLEECESFLRNSAVAPGIRCAEAGLDVAFSDQFRTECKAATESDESLEEFMDHKSNLFERHANMDY